MKRLIATAMIAGSMALALPAQAQPLTRDTGTKTFDQLLARCLTLAGYGAGSTDQVCDALASVISGGLPVSAVAGALAGGGMTTSPPVLSGSSTTTPSPTPPPEG